MSKRKRQEEEQQQLDEMKLIKKPLKFSIDSIMNNNLQQQQHLDINQIHQTDPQQQQQQQTKYSIDNVECTLDNQDIWKAFNSLNTEMIITKTGRRMFPVMKVQFHNLSPGARYAVSMDIVPVDSKRYRYAYHKSCWQVAGKADPSAETRLYAHPDSPLNGDLLSRQVISFEKVKLTNNEADKSGHIILNSMHKYQPRVHLIELKQTIVSTSSTTSSSHHHHHQHSGPTNKQSSTGGGYYNNKQQQQQQQQQQAPQLDIEGYKTFVFPETVFTAVTAYQNQLITKMKIDKNPFAKGFRDSSRLSDLDRGDPFDYMGPLGPGGGGGCGPGGMPGGRPPMPGSLEAAMSGHLDTYQLLASSPWFPAAAVAAAAAASGQSGSAAAAAGHPHGGGAPFGAIGQAAAACSTAQAAQQLQAQMWLAAVNACFSGGATGGQQQQPPPPLPMPPMGLPPMPNGTPNTSTSSATTTPNSPVNPFAAAAAAMFQLQPQPQPHQQQQHPPAQLQHQPPHLPPVGGPNSPQLTVDGDDDDDDDDEDDNQHHQHHHSRHNNHQRQQRPQDEDNQDDDDDDQEEDDEDTSENEQNHLHRQHQHLNYNHHHHQQHLHHLNHHLKHENHTYDSRGGSSADSSGTSV